MTAENALTGQDLALVIGTTEVASVEAIGGLTVADEVVKVGQSATVEDVFGGVTSDAVQPGRITLVVAEGQGQALARQLGEAPTTDGEAQEVTLAVKDADGAVRQVQLRNAWASSWSATDVSADNSAPAIETVQIEFNDMAIE
ncbi:phage tail protein [Streptomyces platensis]|uniref:phage tail protein n=1 Tax=Streptomyces platensis TaxID=58346 RepID=UPI00340B640C